MVSELFEYLLRFTQLPDGTINVAFQFPEKISDKAVLLSIPKFCFPEGVSSITERTSNTESFSFVSTLSDGNKRYGYCRRYFKKDQNPECYCLLSFCASYSLFSQVLDIVELKFSEGDRSVYTFLHSVLAQPFPDPGETVEAQTFSVSTDSNGQIDYIPQTFRLTRSNDDFEYLEYVSYESLFRSLDVDKILVIFQCMLSENRILVSANNLSKLTSCMDAIANMAYPFAWQYVFIPILPATMLTFLGAPMPFLTGILSSCMDAALREPMEEGVLIVDVDKNEFIIMPENFDSSFLPHYQLEKLRKRLKKALASEKRNMEFSILVAHCFIQFFTSIIGNYGKYFETKNSEGSLVPTNFHVPAQVGHEVSFNVERFLKNKPTDIKKFLTSFKESQIFMTFIQERETWALKGIIDSSCILLHAEQKVKSDSILAVRNKLKSKFGQMLAAWNEPSTSGNSKKLRGISPSMSQPIGARSDSFSTSIETSSDDTTTLGSVQPNSEEDSSLTETSSKPRIPARPTISDKSKPTENGPVPLKTFVSNRPTLLNSNYTFRPSPSGDGDLGQQIWKLCNSEEFADSRIQSREGTLYWAYCPLLFHRIPEFYKLYSTAVLGPGNSNSSKIDLLRPNINTILELDMTNQVIESILQWIYSGDIVADSAESVFDIIQAFLPSTSDEIKQPVLSVRTSSQVLDSKDIHKSASKNQSEGIVPNRSNPSISSPAPPTMNFKTMTPQDQYIEEPSKQLEIYLCNLVSTFINQISPENAFITLKLFSSLLDYSNKKSSSSVSSQHSSLNFKTKLAKVIIQKASIIIATLPPSSMTPLLRRQLSGLPPTLLSEILNYKDSTSKRIEAQNSIQRFIKSSNNLTSQKEFTESLENLLLKSQYSDLELILPSPTDTTKSYTPPSYVTISDKHWHFKVHSKILGARSPFMQKFQAKYPGSKVHFTDSSIDYLIILLQFFYTGTLPNLVDDRLFILGLVQTAHNLESDTIAFREALCKAVATSLNSRTVFQFFDNQLKPGNSQQHPSERALLVSIAAYYIANNIILVSQENLSELETDVWDSILKYSYSDNSGTVKPINLNSQNSTLPQPSSSLNNHRIVSKIAPAVPPRKKKS